MIDTMLSPVQQWPPPFRLPKTVKCGIPNTSSAKAARDFVRQNNNHFHFSQLLSDFHLNPRPLSFSSRRNPSQASNPDAYCVSAHSSAYETELEGSRANLAEMCKAGHKPRAAFLGHPTLLHLSTEHPGAGYGFHGGKR